MGYRTNSGTNSVPASLGYQTNRVMPGSEKFSFKGRAGLAGGARTSSPANPRRWRDVPVDCGGLQDCWNFGPSIRQPPVLHVHVYKTATRSACLQDCRLSSWLISSLFFWCLRAWDSFRNVYKTADRWLVLFMPLFVCTIRTVLWTYCVESARL